MMSHQVGHCGTNLGNEKSQNNSGTKDEDDEDDEKPPKSSVKRVSVHKFIFMHKGY